MVRQPLLAEGRSPSCGSADPAGLTFPCLLPRQAGSSGWLRVLPPGHSRRAWLPRRGVLAQAGEVDRGVHITVVHGAAAVTGPGAFGQRQAWLSPAAGRAGLRAGIPPIGDDQVAAVPAGLVAELAPQLSRGGVGQGPVQAPPALAGAGLAPGHVLHREVFDDDDLVPAGEAGGGLVQRVAAQVRYPGVDPR